MRTPVNHIAFDHKPSEEVRAALKGCGFYWNGRMMRWEARQSVVTATACDYFKGWQAGRAFDRADFHWVIGDVGMMDSCGMMD